MYAYQHPSSPAARYVLRDVSPLICRRLCPQGSPANSINCWRSDLRAEYHRLITRGQSQSRGSGRRHDVDYRLSPARRRVGVRRFGTPRKRVWRCFMTRTSARPHQAPWRSRSIRLQEAQHHNLTRWRDLLDLLHPQVGVAVISEHIAQILGRLSERLLEVVPVGGQDELWKAQRASKRSLKLWIELA